MFKSLVLHLRWLRNPGLPQASVTPPLQALSPLLALGQDVSAVPSSPTLMTRPPVLPGGPVHSQVMWPYSLFSGHPHLWGRGERAGWAEGRLACNPHHPPTSQPSPRGTSELTHVMLSPHEVTMAGPVYWLPQSLGLPHWGLSLREGGGSLPRRSSQQSNKSSLIAGSWQRTSVSTKV